MSFHQDGNFPCQSCAALHAGVLVRKVAYGVRVVEQAYAEEVGTVGLVG